MLFSSNINHTKTKHISYTSTMYINLFQFYLNIIVELVKDV